MQTDYFIRFVEDAWDFIFLFQTMCHFINFYLKNLLKLAEKSSNKYDYFNIYFFQ